VRMAITAQHWLRNALAFMVRLAAKVKASQAQACPRFERHELRCARCVWVDLSRRKRQSSAAGGDWQRPLQIQYTTRRFGQSTIRLEGACGLTGARYGLNIRLDERLIL